MAREKVVRWRHDKRVRDGKRRMNEMQSVNEWMMQGMLGQTDRWTNMKKGRSKWR